METQSQAWSHHFEGSPFSFQLEEEWHFLAPELLVLSNNDLAVFLQLSHVSDELSNIKGPSEGVIVERSIFFNIIPTILQVFSKMMFGIVSWRIDRKNGRIDLIVDTAILVFSLKNCICIGI